MSRAASFPHPTRVPRLLTWAFALGAFALGTSENVIAGIVPRLAEAFAVPVADIGLLVTAYAGTAAITGPVLAVLTARISPGRVMSVGLALYGAGTALAVCAPSYLALLAARVLTGALHTSVLVAFMLTALHLARDGEQGRTVGRVTLGLGVATVVGVPVGNALAEQLGWRWAFGLIALLIALTLVIVRHALLEIRAPRAETGWRSLRVLTRSAVLGGIIMTAMAGLGAMTLLAFAVPYLVSTGVSDRAVAPLLLVHGIACLAGNVVGGRLVDRDLGGALTVTLGGTGIALLLATLIGGSPEGAVVALALVGITYFSTFPPLNTWIATSADGVAPGLALATNSSAFNLGIATAGWLGGAALTAGLQPVRLPALGAGALVIALVLSVLLGGRSRQRGGNRVPAGET